METNRRKEEGEVPSHAMSKKLRFLPSSCLNFRRPGRAVGPRARGCRRQRAHQIRWELGIGSFFATIEPLPLPCHMANEYSWTCPQCGRTVPRRIGACRCGFVHQAAAVPPPLLPPDPARATAPAPARAPAPAPAPAPASASAPASARTNTAIVVAAVVVAVALVGAAAMVSLSWLKAG